MKRPDPTETLTLSGLVKGIPHGVAPFPLSGIAEKGWNLLREDMPLPLAVLKASALDHNERWMSAFLGLTGARIAPHGKTTMSPELFRRQLDHGAWAMTVATPQQIEVCRAQGISRVVLANQLIGRQAIRYVLDLLEDDEPFDFYCLVDSLEGVALLTEAVRTRNLKQPLNLLLEGGMTGGRTGCRDLETALRVAERVAQAGPDLRLRGVEGFEGLVAGGTAETQEKTVRDFLDFLVRIAAHCADRDLFAEGPVILSAGGSAFYDLVVERFASALPDRETLLLTRSGCYLSHDTAMYARFFARLAERTPLPAELKASGLKPALEVWAYVQSRPEKGKAILTMGKRDVSYDADLPQPQAWHRPICSAKPLPLSPGHVVTGLNDQHAYMNLPLDSPLAVGDMVCFGISHPCTTFDKWRVIPLIDDDYSIIGAVHTYF